MNDPITTLLKEHDPARDKSLSTHDRARILHAARAPRRRLPRLRFLGALATLTIVLAGVIGIRRERPQPHPPTQPVPVASPRQIQYSTPGGTRIIWTLDPNFQTL